MLQGLWGCLLFKHSLTLNKSSLDPLRSRCWLLHVPWLCRMSRLLWTTQSQAGAPKLLRRRRPGSALRWTGKRGRGAEEEMLRIKNQLKISSKRVLSYFSTVTGIVLNKFLQSTGAKICLGSNPPWLRRGFSQLKTPENFCLIKLALSIL